MPMAVHQHRVTGLRFILPENRDDAKRLLILNQTGQVVAENLAEQFVFPGRAGLGPNAVADLPLDRRERAFGVARFACGTAYLSRKGTEAQRIPNDGRVEAATDFVGADFRPLPLRLCAFA